MSQWRFLYRPTLSYENFRFIIDMSNIKQIMKKFQKHALFQHHVKCLAASAVIIIMSLKMVPNQSDASANTTQMITQNVYLIDVWRAASALLLKAHLHVVVVILHMLIRYRNQLPPGACPGIKQNQTSIQSVVKLNIIFVFMH